MKALVTGSSGFVGSHLVDSLLERNYDLVCLVRKTSNLEWLEGKPVKLHVASLLDSESLVAALEGVDYVFHIAGLTFARNYDEFMMGNQIGTKNLIEAVNLHVPNIKRFLFLSSLTATGPSKTLNEPVNENTDCKPLTSYGKSKRAAELEVLKYSEKLPITIIRAPAVYGPRDKAIFSVFKAVNSGIGTMVGLKPKYLSLIHSTDLVRGIIAAAESESAIGRTYFISSEEFYTWSKLIPLIAQELNKSFVLKIKLPHFIVLLMAGLSEFFGRFSSKPPVFNYEKGIDFIQDYWTCSIEKAKNDFGYSPNLSIEHGIKNTIEWYKEHKWLK